MTGFLGNYRTRLLGRLAGGSVERSVELDLAPNLISDYERILLQEIIGDDDQDYKTSMQILARVVKEFHGECRVSSSLSKRAARSRVTAGFSELPINWRARLGRG